MSLKGNIKNSLSAARQTLPPTITLQSEILPPVKTNVGITHNTLSETITLVVTDAQAHNGQIPATLKAKLLDALYLSPRLTQWNWDDDDAADFRLFTVAEDISVNVTADRVYITKGIRVYDIADGLTANSLFTALKKAQAIVQPVNPQNYEDDAEDYFGPDPNATGADLDSALADPVDDEGNELFPKLNPLEDLAAEQNRDDQKLIEEVCKDDEPGQIAIDEHDPQTKQYVSKNTKQATTEAQQVKKEFPYATTLDQAIEQARDKASDVIKTIERPFAALSGEEIEADKKDRDPKGYPHTANTAVIHRLKSLQGRLLNIVEAAFSEKTQREAVKTLINKEFRREMNNFNRGSWNGFSAQDED